MPSRLLRTDTVANLADSGALPNNAGAAPGNAAAFRAAFDSFGTGPKRVVIPAGLYEEGLEVLSGADRLVLFSGVAATAPAGPSGIPATIRIPSNAVGMVTEMSISGTQATSTTTTLSVDDNTGTDDTRVVHAFVNVTVQGWG